MLCTSEDNADAHLKRQVMGREVVVVVTNGRLDFGTWERIFSGQAEWLARESWRAAPETGVGQNHRGVGAIRAIPAVLEYGTQGHSGRATGQLGTFDRAEGW